jgi:hypothetical protein
MIARPMRGVLSRVEGVPGVVEIDFEPAAEDHRSGLDRYADIAEV